METYLITGIVFFVIFSAIILIHEGGHFWAARLGKIRIEEFGFGLPPRLWGFVNPKSKIMYSLNWIPFGGFVRMLGEDDPNNKKAASDPHAFGNRPLLVQAFAVSAGVIMNFILGWVLLLIAFLIGVTPLLITPQDYERGIAEGVVIRDETGVFIPSVVPESPASQAGILPGDFVTAIDTQTVETPDEFLKIVDKGVNGAEFHLSVLRREYDAKSGAVTKEENLIALVKPNADGKLGVGLNEGRIVAVKDVRLPFFAAVEQATVELGRLIKFTVILLGDVVKSIVAKFDVPDEVGGPVAIAQITHQFVALGSVSELLKFAALLSISIGVLNIMPFPALDGGRLAVIVFQMVSGKKPNAKWEAAIHGTGFILLLLLLVLVTWNDLVRIFTS